LVEKEEGKSEKVNRGKLRNGKGRGKRIVSNAESREGAEIVFE